MRFILVPLNMTLQKRKEKEKQKLLQKDSFCLSIKLFLREMNQLLVLIWSPTHLIYKMIYRFYHEIIKPEETFNYDQHDNVPNENNRERIKNSKYPSASFNGIPEKNQPKYIDFPKTLFGKSSRSFSSKWYKEFPWLHYNLDRCFFLLYMYVSRNKGT